MNLRGPDSGVMFVSVYDIPLLFHVRLIFYLWAMARWSIIPILISFFVADKLLALLSKGITYNDISNQDVSTRSQCVTPFIC
jgi:hypothetical protein